MVIEMILVALVGCYIISSLILFKFPMLIHKRKDIKFVCRHISHRGGKEEVYLQCDIGDGDNSYQCLQQCVEVSL